MQSLLKTYPVWGGMAVWMIHLLRYLVVAGIFYVIYYYWRRSRLASQKIQPRFPKNDDLRREIGYSVATTAIFALVSVALFVTGIRDHNLMYAHWSDYGTAYGLFSFGALVVLHDTYFYWTHRAMHHPRLFKTMHLVHHKSTNPSPWAAYAFHPLEAVVEALIVPIASFILPLHGYTIMAFLVFMMVYNVYGHLGWELFPAHWNRHRLGRWLNTSVNHNQHHQFFRGNYGLYFRFWDEWMDTTRPDYDATFERVTTQSVPQKLDADSASTLQPTH
ncbi:sterol desaturase family protein [Fibrella rubiginis]|nr:sterol desaturase family protein [Fibrella rubiginis]